MKNLTQITETQEENLDRVFQLREFREQAEKEAAQIELEFNYWTGIVISGFVAALIIAGYIVFHGGKNV